MKQQYLKTVGLIAGAVMLVLTSSFAWADGGYNWSRGHAFRSSGHGMQSHGKMMHGFADRLLRHKQQLNLSDEQVTRLKALSLERDVAAIKAHAEVMLAARELRALVSDEKSELSIIEAKVNEQEQLEGKLKMIGIKAKRDAYGILTPEQRDKLKALREQMRHGYRSHMMRTDAGGSNSEQALPAPSAADSGSQGHDDVSQAG
jgi:Spy/CpxP family protein refolding chaperone